MMNETDILNYFKQMIVSWSYLNTSPTMNVLTLNCLNPEYEEIIAEAYKDYIIHDSPVCYYFRIDGNYVNLPKNDTTSDKYDNVKRN